MSATRVRPVAVATGLLTLLVTSVVAVSAAGMPAPSRAPGPRVASAGATATPIQATLRASHPMARIATSPGPWAGGDAPSQPAAGHDEAPGGSRVHFREATPAELKALGLTAGHGPCSGEYDSLPEPPAGTGRICTHGPDFIAGPSATVAPGAGGATDPAAFIIGDGLDPTYAPKGIPCYGQSGPLVHVYYGYQSGGANRLAALTPRILEAVSRADDIFARSASQAGAVRHVRWKMASCKLVITPVAFSSSLLNQALPGPIRANLVSRGLMSTAEKALFFGDEGVCFPGLAGIAEFANDERASSANANNKGGMLSRIVGCAWTPAEDVPFVGEYVAHEVSHTLGAVQNGAPNSSYRTGGSAHCTDGDDIMCYDDGGGEPRAVCVETYPSYLDCRKDDYFSPVPAAGSYIAGHWNTASNQFLSAVTASSQQLPPRPSAALTSPSASGPVSGIVNLAATASTATDGSPIVDVEFWANGELIDTDDSAPYTAILNTFPEYSGYPNGATVRLVALAVDAQGRYMPSTVRTLTIANPRVRLTAPTAYLATSSGNVPWAVTASAGSGLSVAKVEVLDGGSVIATDTSSPYGGTLALALGGHAISARVTDSRGTTRDGQSRIVTVVDRAPTVTMLSPGSLVTPFVVVGATTRLAAVATPFAGRTITGVQFYANGSPIAGTPSLVHGVWELTSWKPTVIGNTDITARATDSSSGTKLSDPGSIEAFYDAPASAHPAVTLTSPGNGTSLGTSANLAANATAPAGFTIDSVTFFVDGSMIGSDSAAPFTATWSSDGIGGARVFWAEVSATDGSFNQEIVDSETVVAMAPPPTTLALTQPAAGAIIKGNFTVTASVSNPTALVSEPIVYLGEDTLIAFLFGPDYTDTVSGAQFENGSTSLRAEADTGGGTLKSAAVGVTFRTTSISLTAPAAGATISSRVSLTAAASGTFEVVPEEVRFRIDGVVVGRDWSSPYAVSWDPATVATGSHSLVAEMTMTDGAIFTTPARAISVAKTPVVTRLAGTDRYATAVAISKASFSAGVPVVYIATGASFPDALAGAPVAGRDKGPLLLVPGTSIPAAVATELTRLKPARIVVLGGASVVSDGVKSALVKYLS